MKKCLFCSQDVDANFKKRADALYCSDACRIKAYRMKNGITNPVTGEEYVTEEEAKKRSEAHQSYLQRLFDKNKR